MTEAVQRLCRALESEKEQVLVRRRDLEILMAVNLRRTQKQEEAG